MLKPVFSSKFKKDIKRLQRQQKDMNKLYGVLTLLVKQTELQEKHRDHILTGNWKGYRDAHIEPDWILIYRIEDDELRLARTGSHSDIFK